MVMTRSMCRNQNYDTSSRKRNRVRVTWSDINHDVLYSVMMRLEVVEFLSFSKVCKSWRLLALSNRKTFMASIPPMILWISAKKYWYLEDFKGREFKTIIPQSVGRECVGLSCGYLIFFGKKTRDFWLVNLFTSHQLHFPDFPLHVDADKKREKILRERIVKGILVFSSSIKGWVFVMLHKFNRKIWFSIAGTGAWDCVSTTSCNIDLHFSKGKIYTLNWDLSFLGKHVCELRLYPVPMLVPKITLPDSLFPRCYSINDFISSDENLYLIEYYYLHMYEIHKLDFDQLNCVPCEKTIQEYSFFKSLMTSGTGVKSEAWAASSSSGVKRNFPHSDDPGKGMMYIAHRWYFPHECLNMNLID